MPRTPNKKSPASKRVDDLSDTEFEKVLSEYKQQETALPSSLFLLAAVLTAVVTVYPFVFLKNNFDLSFGDSNAWLFAVVTGVAGFCLFQTYSKKGAVEVSRLDRDQPNATTNALEATACVIFYANLKFLLLLFVLAFWILPALLPSSLVYVVSVGGPAVLLYADATEMIRL